MAAYTGWFTPSAGLGLLRYFSIDAGVPSKRICTAWCEEEFGELEQYDKGRWAHRINHMFYRFGGQRHSKGTASVYFTNEVDAMAFKLRWL